jgi:RHS repeat-associated protein
VRNGGEMVERHGNRGRDLANGMNLGYTGKPYDSAMGLYNYGYRDYQPETAR